MCSGMAACNNQSRSARLARLAPVNGTSLREALKVRKKNNRMMIMFSWMFSRYCYAQYLGLIICFLSCSLFSKVQSSLDHFEFLPWCYLGIYLLFYFENLFFFLLSKAKPICFKHSSDLFLILNIIAEECLKPTSDNFHRIHWNISFISSEI